MVIRLKIKGKVHVIKVLSASFSLMRCENKKVFMKGMYQGLVLKLTFARLKISCIGVTTLIIDVIVKYVKKTKLIELDIAKQGLVTVYTVHKKWFLCSNLY